MPQGLSRNNHYVPEWYQARFLAGGRARLYYLDKTLALVGTNQGRAPNPRHWVPKRCFCDYDLYTTHFGSNPNDEVERYLFGGLDSKGAIAVSAFVSGDFGAIHDSFEDFFEYLDAQKLRTPKGLDWVRARYGHLAQLDLMLEMQGLRQMHCTMWGEAVREVVSAEQSDAKFIVSDHPVTTYNSAYAPDSTSCAYPEDPLVEQVGTQTVFALDANHCLILTNLEYAQEPTTQRLTAPRTNARYRGASLLRTDAFIRSRKLNRDEVLAINVLLKTRARRFIAAPNEKQLFPEREYSGSWSDIGKVLLPREGVSHFGGETFVKYEDGTVRYQDAFGRTSPAHEFLRKKKPAPENLQPSDPCGCGSGHSYADCCQGLAVEDRPPWDIYGVRERNLMLITAVQKILGLDTKKTWNDVRRGLDDDHVKKIHEVFGMLWPLDTDLRVLLPRPRMDRFRAVYMGFSDPRTLNGSVVGWLPFFDEIVVAHPFFNPARLRPEFSPVHSPRKHREQTLRNVYFLLLLAPYIDAGLVHMIPDPADLSHQLGAAMMRMAEARSRGAKGTQDEDDMGPFRGFARDEMMRSWSRMSPSSLANQIRRIFPKYKEDEVAAVVASFKQRLNEDPFSLLQPIETGETGAQFHSFKGLSLEMSMFLAIAMGAALYSDMPPHWRQLHDDATRVPSPGPDNPWGAFAAAAAAARFPINLDLRAAFTERNEDIFVRLRSILSRAKNAVGAGRIEAAPDLADELRQTASDLEARALPKHHELSQMELSIPQGGFARNEVTRLLVTYGRALSAPPVPLAILVRPPQTSTRSHDA